MNQKNGISAIYKKHILISIIEMGFGGVGIVVFVFSRNHLYSYGLGGKIGLGVAIFALSACIAYGMKQFVCACLDYKQYKSNQYLEITGEVVSFKRNVDPNSTMQINNMPVILLSSGEKMVLLCNDNLSIGGIYVFSYLKYTKIAETKHPSLR